MRTPIATLILAAGLGLLAPVARAAASAPVASKQARGIAGTWDGSVVNTWLMGAQHTTRRPTRTRFVVAAGAHNRVDITTSLTDGAEACVWHGEQRGAVVTLAVGSACMYVAHGATTRVSVISGTVTFASERLEGDVRLNATISGAPSAVASRFEVLQRWTATRH